MWKILLVFKGTLADKESSYDDIRFEVDNSFQDFLQFPEEKKWPTSVHLLWPVVVETIPLTEDIGGPEPVQFHAAIADAVVRGYESFKTDIWPGITKDHPLYYLRRMGDAGLNDAFFHYQKRLYEDSNAKDVSDFGTTWPELDRLPEYRRLRKWVHKLGQQYLLRAGVSEETVFNKSSSVFNWAAVHRSGMYHSPHTHGGEYHVAVFYARAGKGAGKFILSDPRGSVPPFGREFQITPRAGLLVIFPCWLSHMATSTFGDEDRVVIAFNVGHHRGPMPTHMWYKDPLADLRVQMQSRVEPWVAEQVRGE